MLRKLVHSKSDQNFFENKNIIDDISKNMLQIKQMIKKKASKHTSPFNSTPSTPTSSSSLAKRSNSTRNATHFFYYLKHILKIKRKFEKEYFNRYVLPAKISNNILITYIKEYSKSQFDRFGVDPQLIDDFDQIITITNSVTPESLIIEIRTKILVAFERVQLKIKNVHETNFSSANQISFFNSISHTIFFLLSTISYRVDYYSFGMNCLIEQLNKFIDKFLDDFHPLLPFETNSSWKSHNNTDTEYNNSFRLIQKYIQIKLKFIDEFYREGSCYTKFNSLGRFVFNNLNEFISVLDELPFKTNNKKKPFVIITNAFWIHFKPELYYLEDSSFKLSTYLTMFFNSRLAKWKNDFFHPLLIFGEDKEEICRICEQKIKLYHYYLHIYYCLNYVISFQELKKSKKSIKKYLNKIEQSTSTDWGYTSDLCLKENQCDSLKELLSQIGQEINCAFDSYENKSNQCFDLLALINKLMLSCISQSNKNSINSVKCSSLKTKSLLQLVSLLLKRFRIVVDILTLKEMRTKNKMTYCDNHYVRLSPIIKKNMVKSTLDFSKRKVQFENCSLNSPVISLGYCKSRDSTIKNTLHELKSITKDELNNKTFSKSKFCQSYSNTNSNDNDLNDNSNQETTIEIYQDSYLEQIDSPMLVAIPKISDFVLMSHIAKGGYGRVDLYKKASTGDIYAIKTVYLDSMQYSSQVELLKNETSISNELDSEYIVKCYYIISENNFFYFVTEYMPGRDLLGLLNSIILSYKTIQLIVAEIVLGIEYLHSKEIVHKDIKPENVVIGRDGHFKLTDFGISEIYSRQRNKKYIIGNSIGINDLFSETNDDYDENENDNDTEGYSNNPKKDKQGTLYYMAPECFNDDLFTSAVDYWSLGVVLFELFTLKQPFQGSSTNEIKQNILTSDINWSFFNDEDVTSNYNQEELNNAKDLINKLLIKDPLMRYNDKDTAKIKSHPFFNGFNWKEIKSIKDYQVLLYVKKMIEKSNQQIKDANRKKAKMKKHNCQAFSQVLLLNEKKFIEQTHPFYYSERVDNIFKKCLETMHKIIDSNPYNDSINKNSNMSFNTSDTTLNDNDSQSMSSTIGNSPFSHLDN